MLGPNILHTVSKIFNLGLNKSHLWCKWSNRAAVLLWFSYEINPWGRLIKYTASNSERKKQNRKNEPPPSKLERKQEAKRSASAGARTRVHKSKAAHKLLYIFGPSVLCFYSFQENKKIAHYTRYTSPNLDDSVPQTCTRTGKAEFLWRAAQVKQSLWGHWSM